MYEQLQTDTIHKDILEIPQVVDFILLLVSGK